MHFRIKYCFLPLLFVRSIVLLAQQVIPGAFQFQKYENLIKGKKVVVVANQTSMVGNVHLVDTLLKRGIDITKVFAPEHGFRGLADAGKEIKNSIDKKTGLPVVSLYGKSKKPTTAELKDVDWVIYDIQDVGVRFYTYISTLHLVMEACAENHVKLLLLDRPDPLGYYVDGPVLDTAHFRSFVGMDPVPVVYGMTPGEYAKMLNGEGWLKNHEKCNLTVIKCKNYNHNTFYKLPVRPSPNLPDMASIYLYPSLCFFEGTIVSVGRGTDKPYQVFGHPDLKKNTTISFTPKPTPGAMQPKLQGKLCKGLDLQKFSLFFLKGYNKLYLFWLISTYNELEPKYKAAFFTKYFDLLVGTDQLKKQIIAGKTEKEIRASWQNQLSHFKQIRKKYLLYPDFK